MNIKSTYIRRLWIFLLICTPSLHANIYDLFNLKGIEYVEVDLQYVISYHVLQQMPQAYLPLTLDCGVKSSEKPAMVSTAWRVRFNDWDGRSSVIPIIFSTVTVYAAVQALYKGENPAEVVQRINEHINGRNFSIAQMFLIKLLYATKIRDIPTSFALISKHNPQVSEGELWHIFGTFSTEMQRSLASKYDLVAGE